MCEHGQRTVVIGISSFGSRCTNDGRPEIFARVCYILDWIASIVNGHKN